MRNKDPEARAVLKKGTNLNLECRGTFQVCVIEILEDCRTRIDDSDEGWQHAMELLKQLTRLLFFSSKSESVGRHRPLPTKSSITSISPVFVVELNDLYFVGIR